MTIHPVGDHVVASLIARIESKGGRSLRTVERANRLILCWWRLAIEREIAEAQFERIAELETELAKADEELEKYHPDRSGGRR